MSQQNQQLTIGLFGFGVVGEGLYQVLRQTPSLNAFIKKVCIKHPEKKRNAPEELFTANADELLEDASINVIVELIDDADAAFNIAVRALNGKKALVSASKKMIAEHLPELLQLQADNACPFLYEAACCAGIPVIRNLEEYYDNDLLQGFQGIVNGSTNFILTRIAQEGLSFSTALKLAQDKGFAESDPKLDVEGIDAVNKLSILLAHAYGLVEHPQRIVHGGIQNLKQRDAVFASEKQHKIKLVAQAKKLRDGKIAAFVLPQFVRAESNLHLVDNEYNGLIIESGLADTQFFSGKGAGSFPTASAVLSDLSALRYSYKYEYKKMRNAPATECADDFYLHVYASFDKGVQVPQQLFAQIHEWTENQDGSAISGILHVSCLRDDWWKQAHTSLVLYPNPILEASELPKQLHELAALRPAVLAC